MGELRGASCSTAVGAGVGVEATLQMKRGTIRVKILFLGGNYTRTKESSFALAAALVPLFVPGECCLIESSKRVVLTETERG